MFETSHKLGSLFFGLSVLVVVSSGCSPVDQPLAISMPKSKVQQPAAQAKMASDGQDSRSVDVEVFTELLTARSDYRFGENLSLISKDWDVTYTPMMLEVARFMRQSQRSRIVALLEEKTGQKIGNNITKWWHWYWANHEETFIDYAEFKSKIYSRIDPSFSKYFEGAEFSEIRLDEIFWGGVKRDGIPPLKEPIMQTAEAAKYLGDSDVVFGIKLNGEAKCYPKRILAWHEMFKDTIGGESVCGVY